MDINDLYKTIAEMHLEGWKHKRRGFALNDANPFIASNHLIEEVAELQAEVITGCRPQSLEEAADVLGVFLHLLFMLGIPIQDVVELTGVQLRIKFVPPSTDIDRSGFTRSSRQ